MTSLRASGNPESVLWAKGKSAMSNSYRRLQVLLMGLLGIAIIGLSVAGERTASAGSGGKKIQYQNNHHAYRQCTKGNKQDDVTPGGVPDSQLCNGLDDKVGSYTYDQDGARWIGSVKITWYYYADKPNNGEITKFSDCSISELQDGPYVTCSDSNAVSR